jgi:transcription elongation factor Elf1
MSGLDEQIRCERCGSHQIVFTSPFRRIRYDLVVDNTSVYFILPATEIDITINSPKKDTLINDFYAEMSRENSGYMWTCKICRKNYLYDTELYSKLVDIVRMYVNERARRANKRSANVS